MFNLCDIYALYTEEHRHYHNLEHITRMFMVARSAGMELTEAQIFAIWFHDAVYCVPTTEPGQNEHESAVLAGAYLSEWYDIEFCEKVETIIMDTRNHVPSMPESEVVIDLDLWDLADPRRYWTNLALIRREMLTGHTLEEFNTGRPKWLRGMYDRDRVFHSTYATPGMERRAKDHLGTELTDVYCAKL